MDRQAKTMQGIADIRDGLVSDDDEVDFYSAPPPLSLEAACLTVDREGTVTQRTRTLAAEVPVSITFNGLAYAVMMVSPLDIEDFVTGFALTEQVIERASEIDSIDVRPVELGLLAQVWIPEARARNLMESRRNLVGQTGCGICGIVELEQAVRRYGAISNLPTLDTAAIFAAHDSLASLQPLNAATGAVHAAAFADASGHLLAVREDVGRHNALDKLIGHLARTSIAPSSGFVFMTSRISFELVQKCVATNIPGLVGISAPTDLAVRLSQEYRLTLAALARSDGFQVFSDPFGLWPPMGGGPIT